MEVSPYVGMLRVIPQNFNRLIDSVSYVVLYSCGGTQPLIVSTDTEICVGSSRERFTNKSWFSPTGGTGASSMSQDLSNGHL